MSSGGDRDSLLNFCSDKFRVEQRLDQMEREMHELREVLLKFRPDAAARLPGAAEGSGGKTSNEVAEMLHSTAELATPWLFSCANDVSVAAIQLMLDFVPDQTAELDVRDWRRESDMWVDFLENVPDTVMFEKPSTLSLSDLRLSVRSALAALVDNDVLIVIASVPGRDQENEQSNTLRLIGVFCASIGEALRTTSDHSVTRVVVVLQGHGIGNKLSVGDQKYVIEPLK